MGRDSILFEGLNRLGYKISETQFIFLAFAGLPAASIHSL